MWRREKWYGSTADVCHSLVQPPANVISLGYRYLEREHRTVSQSIFSRLRPLLDAKMSCCNWFVREAIDRLWLISCWRCGLELREGCRSNVEDEMPGWQYVVLFFVLIFGTFKISSVCTESSRRFSVIG